jgi:hypothetical protein
VIKLAEPSWCPMTAHVSVTILLPEVCPNTAIIMCGTEQGTDHRADVGLFTDHRGSDKLVTRNCDPFITVGCIIHLPIMQPA